MHHQSSRQHTFLPGQYKTKILALSARVVKGKRLEFCQDNKIRNTAYRYQKAGFKAQGAGRFFFSNSCCNLLYLKKQELVILIPTRENV
jgi:hypothetical protein